MGFNNKNTGQKKAEEPMVNAAIESLSPAEEQAALEQIYAAQEMERAAAAAEEDAASHAERGEILIERTIDPHEGRLATVVGYWAPLTPSMCAEAKCGYDAALDCKNVSGQKVFPQGWDQIPENMASPDPSYKTMQEWLLAKLELHKSAKHAAGKQSHIRTAEEVAARRTRQHVLPEGFVTNPRV